MKQFITNMAVFGEMTIFCFRVNSCHFDESSTGFRAEQWLELAPSLEVNKELTAAKLVVDDGGCQGRDDEC